MSSYSQLNQTAVCSRSSDGSGRITPRRSGSPALENGLTKLSLSHESSSSSSSSKGAIWKTQNGQTFRTKIRHATEPSFASRNSSFVVKERHPSRNSILSVGGNQSQQKKKKKKSLSFSDSHLLSQSSASFSSSSLSSPCKIHGDSTVGSGSLLSDALTTSGRRIHVILPNAEASGAAGTDATPDDIITPDSFKSVSKSPGKVTKGQNQPQQRPPKKELKPFESYMKLDELQRGLKRGELLEGVLRINPKNYQDAYISVPGGPDIFLGGIHDRNRALNGDVVVVVLKPKHEWKIQTVDLRTFLVRNCNFFSAGTTISSILTTRFPNTIKTGKETNTSVEIKEDCPRPALGNTENTTGWATWNGHDACVPVAEVSGSFPAKKRRRKRGMTAKKKEGYSATVTQCDSYEQQSKPVLGAPRDSKKKNNKSKRSSKRKDKPSELCDGDDGLINENADPLSEKPRLEVHNAPVRDVGAKWAVERVANERVSATNEDGWNLAAAEAQVAVIQLEDLLMETPNVLEVSDEYEVDADLLEVSGVVPPDELSELDDSISDGSNSCCHDVHEDAEDLAFFKRNEELGATESVLKRLDDLYYPGRKTTGLKPTVTNHVKLLVTAILEKRSTKKLEELTIEDVLELPDGSMFVQRSAKVVYIVERKNSCLARGYLKPMKDKESPYALFVPIDNCIPRMRINFSNCPPDFELHPKKYAKVLFIARLTEWENDGLATGQLCRSLCEGDLVENETDGILIENNIDCSDFSPQALKGLPLESSWSIPPEELAWRRDFRNTCVLTIDPATARDLDDAVSCDQLNDGLYHVAVHIADVSHFVRCGTVLDTEASRRATSVYLVQKVVPMLPRLLCEKVCSLNPDEDRLTFSVEWIIREDGAVLEERFGRTVIRSCAKLSYDDAQYLISYGSDALPAMRCRWSADDIADRVKMLHKLAVLLRKKRCERGALRLDKTKIYFKLDETTGLPNGYGEYVIRDSNRLIEEFMLLANMAVSRKIYQAFPELAVLRRHPPPQEKGLQEVVESCKSYGIFLDASSSQSLQESLVRYSNSNDELGLARVQVLMTLLSKPMNCAEYFCSGCIKNGETEDDFWHYALNVPFYTHFTSPIRRYPDILVHRLLAAALGYDTKLCRDPMVIHKQLMRCNDMKMTAKRVNEMSSELFLAIYIKNVGHVEEVGMVCRVLDHSFDVLVLKVGIVRRIFCEQLKNASYEYTEECSVPRLRLIFRSSADVDSPLPCSAVNVLDIMLFTLVGVSLTTTSETPLKINATLKTSVFLE